jgi:hypothetical protein
MKPSGKPDAGNLPVRFDEGDGDGEGRTISTLRSWSLVPGRWSLVAGRWSLVAGP